MGKKFWLSVVCMFVLSMLLDFAVHSVLLGADYAKLPALYRAPQDSAGFMPFMLLAHVFIALGLVWVYQRGVGSGAWLGQGLRYGSAMAVLIAVPGYLIYYAVQPLPADLVLKQIAFGVAQMLLLGIALAWLQRKPEST